MIILIRKTIYDFLIKKIKKKKKTHKIGRVPKSIKHKL